MNIKFSIVTVVKNGMPYLQDALESFLEQDYFNKEIIIVASKSNDGTEQFIKQNKKNINKFIINSDLNLYESINKGICLSSGEYVFILHSDDIFYGKNILKNVSKIIKKEKADLVFGNIIYVNRQNINQISRVWITSAQKNYISSIHYGWSPPHTAIFVKKEICLNYLYNKNFKISSDYDFIIKCYTNNNIKKFHYNNFISIMRDGGISNANILNLYLKLKEDLKIINKNKISLLAILIKRFGKLTQFFPSIFYKNLKLKISNKILSQNQILVTKNMKILNNTNGFIYSALNLAFLGFVDKIRVNRNYVLWPDGIGSKLIDYKIKKTPGRDLVIPLLQKIKYSNILILGNYNNKIDSFIKKFTNKVRYFTVPFGEIEEIQNKISKLKFKKKELIFINIPTPKQEILANYILKKNNQTKIICIGGGLNMVSGLEKKIPLLFEKMGLEFLWRLRIDTIRRSVRLIQSLIGLIYNYKTINSISKNFKILKS